MLVVKPNNPYTFTNHLTQFDGTPAISTQPGEYTVVDSVQKELSKGALFLGDADGDYFFTWGVPGDPLSNPYTIKWAVQTTTGAVQTESFFTIEEDVAEDFLYTTLVSEGFKTISMDIPEAGSYRINFYDDHESVVYTTIVNIPNSGKQNVALIGDSSALYSGEYVVTLENTQSFEQSLFNMVVAPIRFWHLLPRLRIYIDRAKLPFYQIKAFQDSQMYNYFIEGMDRINRTGPLTNWDWNSYPFRPADYGMEGGLVMAAGLYALRSQYLLENSLSFDYQGPNISVDYDHAAGLESEITRLEGELDDIITEAKRLIWSKGPVGNVNHRRQGARSYARNVRRYR